MEFFRFVPPTILSLLVTTVLTLPNPQVASFTGGVGFPAPAAPILAPAAPIPAPAPGPQPTGRFLGFNGGFGAPAPVPVASPQPSGRFQGFNGGFGAPAPAPVPVASPGLQPSGRFFGFNGFPGASRPQQIQPSNRPPPGRFGFLPPPPVFNQNQGLQNTLAGGGLAAVGGIAAGQCLFGGNCDLSFRPSLGAAIDANGQIVPQLGITTQVGNGEGGVETQFTGGIQLDGNSQSGIGGFVAGGVNDGNKDGVSLGAQTGFGFSQGANGQTQATAQVGGNIQAPQVAGINFNRPGTALGIQPTVLGQAAPQLNLLNLFGGRPGGGGFNGFNFGRR